jgi:CubicO group peptidase (beta-lactamase class C family)
MSLSYLPGEHFSYFNPNYSLLGIVVERVSGQSYARYLEEHIIKPLGLQNTSVRGAVDTPGHLSFFGISVERSEPFIQYDLPAGYITSAAEDLVRYLEALRMRLPAVGLSPAGIEQMEAGTPYGMGWMRGYYANRPAVHHDGSLPGYAANAIMLVEDEYSIAFLINKNHFFNALIFYPDISEGLVSILTGQEPPSRVNYFWTIRLIMVLFAASLISSMLKTAKLVFRSGQKTIRQRVIAIFINLAIPAALLLLISLATGAILSGMTWDQVFLFMPDLMTWLYAGIAFHVIESLIHIAFLSKQKVVAS